MFLDGLHCEAATFAGTARFTDAVFEDDVQFAGAGPVESWWFLGAKVTNLQAVLEIPGFQLQPDGTIAAEQDPGPGRSTPGEVRPSR